MKDHFKALPFFVFLLCCPLLIFAQNIKPYISARVDTSKTEVKAIYQLYTNYLNSRPDSSYANPYWNKNDYYPALLENQIPIDRSASLMFGTYFKGFMKYYEPLILQIDSLNNNLYQVKTIFKSNKAEADSTGTSISYITNLYVQRDENGNFKLENTINERTRNWETIHYKFITYIIHPNCKFNEKEAENAIKFCEEIAKKFGLQIKPFKYYILPNVDELGRIYNFDYWTYYIGGQTNLPLREIFTTYSNTNYPHELVHMMFPLQENPPPNIISEGLATWLGGPKYGVSFEQALKETSKTLKTYENPTFEAIVNNKIRNKFDSNLQYVTGAILCKMAFEKKGKEAIWTLYHSDKKDLDKNIENIFGKPINEIHEDILTYILKE
nr:hypothetical protein [Pseudopedobacter sp.]